jgi:hypothetical protein
MKLTKGPFQELLSKHLKESDPEVPDFTFKNLVTKPHDEMLRNSKYEILHEELKKIVKKMADEPVEEPFSFWAYGELPPDWTGKKLPLPAEPVKPRGFQSIQDMKAWLEDPQNGGSLPTPPSEPKKPRNRRLELLEEELQAWVKCFEKGQDPDRAKWEISRLSDRIRQEKRKYG